MAFLVNIGMHVLSPVGRDHQEFVHCLISLLWFSITAGFQRVRVLATNMQSVFEV